MAVYNIPEEPYSLDRNIDDIKKELIELKDINSYSYDNFIELKTKTINLIDCLDYLLKQLEERKEIE